MEEIYAQNAGKVDAPHRHDFYTVLIIKRSKGKHHIDFNTYKLGNAQIYFVAPGQVHQLVEEEMSEGYSLLFTQNFLLENNIQLRFIEDLNLFHDFGESPPLTLNEVQIDRILDYAKQMEALCEMASDLKYDAVGSLLKLILIHCNLYCSLDPEEPSQMDPSATLLGRFKDLINEHNTEWHQLSQYADALNVSSDYLNRVVKSRTGKRAKNHIQSRIMIAAKRLLYFSDKSNKEIAFELGFQEPSHFSSFFKNCAGISPSAFKQLHK